MTAPRNYQNEKPRWHGAQRRIGITGGIASGKSSVGEFLVTAHSLPILDADAYAKEELAPGTCSSQAILKHFGKPIVHEETGVATTIDRSALGKIIFANKNERLWLEQQLHPQIRQRMVKELDASTHSPVIVLMIPLLFEAKLECFCSEVWIVDCTVAQQRQRLMTRDHLTIHEANLRIESQWPLSQKKLLADVVIDNTGMPRSWQEQIEKQF